MTTTREKIILILTFGILTLLVLISAVVAWQRGQNNVVLKKEFQPANELKQAGNIPRMSIPVKKIVALEKKAITKKLKLKAPLATDDAQQIIATATVPASEGKTSAIAVMNTATGETHIEARQEAPSLFGFENKKEIGIRYGVTTGYGTEGALYGRWDFLRIGNVHLGAYGEVNTQGDGKAMLSAAYRW